MSSFLEGEMGRAVVRAARAPSVHNTQPWRYAVSRGSLELYADENRRLRVLDPRGRQLLIGCGCALLGRNGGNELPVLQDGPEVIPRIVPLLDGERAHRLIIAQRPRGMKAAKFLQAPAGRLGRPG